MGNFHVILVGINFKLLSNFLFKLNIISSAP